MAKRLQKELMNTSMSDDQQTLLGLNYFLYGKVRRLESQNKRNNFWILTVGAVILFASYAFINQRNHAANVQPGFDYEGLKIYLSEICGTFILKTIVSGFNNMNLTQALKGIDSINAIYKSGLVSKADKEIITQIIYDNKLEDKIPQIHWQSFK